MNTQRLASLRISPLHVQQGLFASLALMITLIVVQQFSHWHQQQDSALIQHTWHHSAPLATATALKYSDVTQRAQPVDDAQASTDLAPRQQSWVF